MLNFVSHDLKVFGTLCLMGTLNLACFRGDDGQRMAPASALANARDEGEAADRQKACQVFKDKLPKSVLQNYLTVPEDWSNPGGRKVKIFFYLSSSTTLISGNLSEPRIPVVFFNGGPGSDSHSLYEYLSLMEANLPIRFIYVDQRGTGCSDPFPEGETPETWRRLSHYTSRSIVKDAEAIRKKLFGEATKWNVFGQSFGSLIVHRYLEVAPEGIKAAYAHGFAPTKDPLTFITSRIESQKAAGDQYFATYPDDVDRLAKLRRLIPNDLCFEKAKVRDFTDLSRVISRV